MIWALENDGAYSIFFLLPLVFPTHKPEEKKRDQFGQVSPSSGVLFFYYFLFHSQFNFSQLSLLLIVLSGIRTIKQHVGIHFVI